MPWPILLGPPPRMIILFLLEIFDSLEKFFSSIIDLSYEEYKYGVLASNSAAQLSILLYDGITFDLHLVLLTLDSVESVKNAIRESAKPLDFK